jgi:hypothetical protein
MDRVGISFRSSLNAEEVRLRYIQPLRAAVEEDHVGIYSNYLRQAEADSASPAEHLLIFQVRDFEAGLHLLRMKLQEIGLPEHTMFHNLAPSEPMY